MRILLFSLLLPLAAFGQPGADVRPRVLGAVFDGAAQGVRPIYGSPGAAVLGDRYEVGADFGLAAVSARHGYALAAQDGRVTVFSLAPARAVAGFDLPAGLLALSPLETAAAAFSAESRTLSILAGLPGAPRVAQSLSVPGAAEVTAIAVNDGGTLALAADAGGAVLALAAGAPARQVAAAGRIAAIRFVDGAALLADEEREAVLRLSLDDFSLTTAARLPGPAADAALSGDGRLFAVARGSRAVYAADAATGAVAALECDCSPTRLSPLPGRSRFQLTEPLEGAVWILDAGRPEPALFFVPSGTRGKE